MGILSPLSGPPKWGDFEESETPHCSSSPHSDPDLWAFVSVLMRCFLPSVIVFLCVFLSVWYLCLSVPLFCGNCFSVVFVLSLALSPGSLESFAELRDCVTVSPEKKTISFVWFCGGVSVWFSFTLSVLLSSSGLTSSFSSTSSRDCLTTILLFLVLLLVLCTSVRLSASMQQFLRN